MSTMQTPPPLQSRQMSQVAVNTIVSSLVTVAGIVLVIIAAGFVILASYILRSALLLQLTHDSRDLVPLYMGLSIIPSLCAIVTFIFGLRIVARGLGRLMQQGTSGSTGSSKPVI